MKFIQISILAIFILVIQSCAVGDTVHQVYANPVSVSYEYTHWYSGEKAFAMQKAEEHCNRFGKHAQIASESPSTVDRTSISFNCVSE